MEKRIKLSENSNEKELQNKTNYNKTQKSTGSIKRFKTINNKRNSKSSNITEKFRRLSKKTVSPKLSEEKNEEKTLNDNTIKNSLLLKRKSSRIKENEIQFIKEIQKSKNQKALKQKDKAKNNKRKEEEKNESTPLKNLAKQPKSILKNVSKENDMGKDNNPILSNISETSKLLTKYKKIKPSTEIDYDYDLPLKLNRIKKTRKFVHIIEFKEKERYRMKNKIKNKSKDNLLGRKRIITFSDEKTINEYNPNISVKDMKKKIEQRLVDNIKNKK